VGVDCGAGERFGFEPGGDVGGLSEGDAGFGDGVEALGEGDAAGATPVGADEVGAAVVGVEDAGEAPEGAGEADGDVETAGEATGAVSRVLTWKVPVKSRCPARVSTSWP